MTTAIKTKTVYIAGPMTGIEQHNFPAFFSAENELSQLGLEVANPARHGDIGTWESFLRQDLQDMLSCNFIALLPNWKDSRGASLEVSVGEAVGIRAWPLDLILAAGGNTDQIPEPPREASPSCLEAAAKAVDGPRQENYGHPIVNHRRIADFWTTRIQDKLLPDTRIEPHEASAMMRLVKEARLIHTPGHDDSLIDLCGYARVEEMIHEAYRQE